MKHLHLVHISDARFVYMLCSRSSRVAKVVYSKVRRISDPFDLSVSL